MKEQDTYQEQDIRLVCCDIDGTLIQGGDDEISPEVLALIPRLAARGIRFAPASGRQLVSLQRLFAPVAQHCLFLCENGAAVFDHTGQLLAKTVIPRVQAEEIALDFWQRSDGRGEVLLSGVRHAYLWSRGLGAYRHLERIGGSYSTVGSLSEIGEDIIKVSLFVPDGTPAFEARFIPRWRQFNAAVAGECWIDTTAANKGSGVLDLCRVLDISPRQAAAFGDNFNDAPMLDVAGWPFIMDAADPALRKKYPLHTPRPEPVLRRLAEGERIG